MSVEKYVARHLIDSDEFRSTCGFRRAIFTESDDSNVSMSVIRINDSTKHWHKKTHEIYYVLEGEGSIELDDVEVGLSPGSALLVKPGVRHSAKGDLTVIVVGTPPFRDDDMFFDEQ